MNKGNGYQKLRQKVFSLLGVVCSWTCAWVAVFESPKVLQTYKITTQRALSSQQTSAINTIPQLCIKNRCKQTLCQVLSDQRVATLVSVGACFHQLNIMNRHLLGLGISEKWFTVIVWLSTFVCAVCIGLKGIAHPKIKIKSSFTHPGVVLMQYDVLSFMDHKRRIYFKCLTRPYNASKRQTALRLFSP